MSYPVSHHDETFETEDSVYNNSLMFTPHQQHNLAHSFYPSSTHDSPQGWPPYDQTLLPPFHSQPLPHRGLPTSAPYPVQRLSSPLNTAGGGHVTTNMPRLSLAGSLDPATGIFYRTPDHPRLRTAQACEKCRTRKAKCSGEHPSCKRCVNRGLVCEYAKEGRVRGPNKVKNTMSVSIPSLKNASASTTVDLERSGSTPSANSGISPVDRASTSSLLDDGIMSRDTSNPPIPPGQRSPSSPFMVPLNAFSLQSPPNTNFRSLSQHAQTPQDAYSLPTSGVSSESSSRRNSLTVVGVGSGEHRASRPRPANISLDATGQWHPGCIGGSHQAGWIGQPNRGIDFADFTAEVPMSLQSAQRHYERNCLAREQHQRYLQEQRRLVTMPQTRTLEHQRASTEDCQDFLHQSSSLPTMSVSPSQCMHPEVDSTFQTHYQVYTPAGEYQYQPETEYPQGLQSEMHVHGYIKQVASTMARHESYQRATMGMEPAGQGVGPPLSRVGERVEMLTDGSASGERPAMTCLSSVDHEQRGMDNNAEQSSWV